MWSLGLLQDGCAHSHQGVGDEEGVGPLVIWAGVHLESGLAATTTHNATQVILAFSVILGSPTSTPLP